MMNVMFAGNSKVFDGVLTGALSIFRRSEQTEGIRFFVLTMDVSHIKPEYTPISERQIAFLDRVAKSYHPDNSFERVDVTDLYREEFAACKEKVIFVEIQLLFETHSEDLFDQIVVVMRGREERIRAVAARNGLTREEVSARIQSQFDYENLPKNAHTVIYNDSGLGELEKKVTVLLDDIQAKI